MMNSIWGLYNRNSPHNFKKNNAAGDGADRQQQVFVAAGAAFAASKTIDPNGNAALSLDINPSSLLGQPIYHEDFYHTDYHKIDKENGPSARHNLGHGHHENHHRHHDTGRFEEILQSSMI